MSENANQDSIAVTRNTPESRRGNPPGWKWAAWLACLSLLTFAVYWNWTSPTALTAKADGDALRAAVEQYRALHGVYPDSLGAAEIHVPRTRYHAWQYAVRDHGTRFELTAGDYGEDGFIVRWDSNVGHWWEDT